MKTLPNGTVCSPRGYRAAGVIAGIKSSGKADVALLVTDPPAQFAAAFTANAFAAAPVQYSRQVAARADALSGVVINSGNANACTGRLGLHDAEAMAARAAEKLGLKAEQFMVCSTGRIGVPLPMDKVLPGVDRAAAALAADNGLALAEAIMTTDTVPKTLAVEIVVDGVPVRLGGAAKGVGMIAPRLLPAAAKHATMFGFITTDAALEPGVLAGCLGPALEQSFNRITVDGDMSTNDTVIALANGAAGNRVIRPSIFEAELFQQALNHVTAELAKMMVRDGEGATKFVEVHVSGAKTPAEAQACARAIANSLLCKTAWFGGDPNWGRVLAAAGYAGVALHPDRVSLAYNRVPVVRGGVDAGTPEAKLSEVLRQREFRVDLDLAAGDAESTVWTCDVSYDYVKINAEYHT